MSTIKNLFTLVLVLCSSTLLAQVDYQTIQVKSSYSGSWGTQRAKVVSLIPNYTSVTDGSDDFTRNGTYKYLRTDSTGYYYVKKIDGRWWIIDPNGYAGINMAVTSFGSSNIQNDYDLVRNIGFNGTGNFLSSESQTKSGYNFQNYPNFSFTRRLNFFLSYKNDRKNYYTTPTAIQGSLDHIVVFDPQFPLYCDNLAKTYVTPYATERDLLGYFTDNEINFNQDQLQNLVRDLPAGDPSRDSALVFAASKGLTETDCITYSSKVTEAIKQEFAILLANRYYKTVSEAIHKYDQTHLILGSRLNGRPRAIQGVVDASEKYMDVTSVNFYDRFTANEQIAKSTWTNDKPCLVGEFYIKDINAFTTTQSGAGWYVNSQASRGDFYQNTCLELLQNKCFVGWQYFRYQDDTDSNKGIVNLSGTEYTGMTTFMNELNKQVYRLCDFYDGKDRRPKYNTDTITKLAVEDTYVIPGATNTDNYGTSKEMEVRYNSLESNRRDTYLKFDLSDLKDSMSYLKHADLELYCTSSDATVRSIFVSGLEDNSWQENIFTGAERQINPDWKNGYNRLDSYKSVIRMGPMTFDVTTWLFDMIKKGLVSFKVHDLLATNTSIKIASRENDNVSYRPKLKLTFWNRNTTDIPTLESASAYRIYPNPGSDVLNIEGNDITEINLFTLAGQLVSASSSLRNDISTLTPGIYLMKIKTNAGKVIIRKFVKK